MTGAESRRVAIGLSAVVLVSAVGVVGYQVLSSAEPGSDLVTYHEAPPADPPRADTDEIQDQLSQASELVDFNSDDFAGAYLASGSEVVVSAATDRGENLADAWFVADAGVTVTRVPFSLDDVEALGSDLVESDPRLAEKVLGWQIEPVTAALRIDVLRALDEGARDLVEDFAAEHSLPIEVYLDEGEERPTLGGPS